MSIYMIPLRPDELFHFGIKGMHWGIRKYQNADGSLTPAGKERYRKMQNRILDSSNYFFNNNSWLGEEGVIVKEQHNIAKLQKRIDKRKLKNKNIERLQKKLDKSNQKLAILKAWEKADQTYIKDLDFKQTKGEYVNALLSNKRPVYHAMNNKSYDKYLEKAMNESIKSAAKKIKSSDDLDMFMFQQTQQQMIQQQILQQQMIQQQINDLMAQELMQTQVMYM